MKTISATDFKAQCLALMDDLSPEGIVITKHGKPVAQLTPVKSGNAHLIGKLKGRLVIKGDIMSTGVKWDAESGHSYLAEKSDGRANKPRAGRAAKR
jgi:prevent-host-death family protein